MDRIQEVRLANSIVTHKAVDLLGETEFSPGIIFKAGQQEFFQVHFIVLFPGFYF